VGRQSHSFGRYCLACVSLRSQLVTARLFAPANGNPDRDEPPTDPREVRQRSHAGSRARRPVLDRERRAYGTTGERAS